MSTGIVKWYNDAKCFGFAIEDATQQKILLLRDNITNDPQVVFELDKISFDIQQSEDGPVAVNIKTVEKFNMKFYDHEFRTLNGENYHLSKYCGRVLLVVNTASHCGLTPQYKELEDLYQKYKLDGFTVLAFPSDNFANQEFKENTDIATFCETNFATSFPIFEKTNVVKNNKADLDTVLETDSRPINSFFNQLASITGVEPIWNFQKYLVNKDGSEIIPFDIRINPLSYDIEEAIKRMLK